MNRRGRAIVGVSIIGAALVYLLGAGIESNLVYYLTPSEVLAKGVTAYDTPLRLSGQVEPGSIRRSPGSQSLSFRVRDDAAALDVEARGIPPEMFHDGIDVVLEGTLSASGIFQASTLMVKHSNEYGPDEGGVPAAERFRNLDGSGGDVP